MEYLRDLRSSYGKCDDLDANKYKQNLILQEVVRLKREGVDFLDSSLKLILDDNGMIERLKHLEVRYKDKVKVLCFNKNNKKLVNILLSDSNRIDNKNLLSDVSEITKYDLTSSKVKIMDSYYWIPVGDNLTYFSSFDDKILH